MAKKKDFKVPFYGKDQCTYSWGNTGYTHKDNFEFSADLEYQTFSRGRSSLNITWKNHATGYTYQSSMMLLDEVLSGRSKSAVMVSSSDKLVIGGKFTFKKQGQSILLKVCDD